MFSHSTRDLSAIRFHSLDTLMLRTLGVTVCSIVHSASTFAACRGARRSNAQVFATALGATGRSAKAGPAAIKVTRIEGADIVMPLNGFRFRNATG